MVTDLKLLLSTSVSTSVNGTVKVIPKKGVWNNGDIIVITFGCVMLSVGLDALMQIAMAKGNDDKMHTL